MSFVFAATHDGFSVGPASEALIFGGLSSLTFPLGALLASAVASPQASRRHVAALLALSAGAVLQSLLHEVFGSKVQAYLSRAESEQEIRDAAQAAVQSDLDALTAEEGKKQLLDDETSACAWASLLLCAACAPLGAWVYIQAHAFALRRLPDVDKPDQRLAVGILVAQLVDVVPSGALVGLFVVRHELKLVLLLSLLLANLPAAMSACLLGRSCDSPLFQPQQALMAWGGLCAATAALAGAFARLFLVLFPTLSGHVGDDYLFASVEGLSAGAMLVVLASQYLPDATEQLGPANCGLLVVLGVVGAAVLAACGGSLSLGAGRSQGLVDLPNLTTTTGPLQQWGFGGAAMPDAGAPEESG